MKESKTSKVSIFPKKKFIVPPYFFKRGSRAKLSYMLLLSLLLLLFVLLLYTGEKKVIPCLDLHFFWKTRMSWENATFLKLRPNMIVPPIKRKRSSGPTTVFIIYARSTPVNFLPYFQVCGWLWCAGATGKVRDGQKFQLPPLNGVYVEEIISFRKSMFWHIMNGSNTFTAFNTKLLKFCEQFQSQLSF